MQQAPADSDGDGMIDTEDKCLSGMPSEAAGPVADWGHADIDIRHGRRGKGCQQGGKHGFFIVLSPLGESITQR